MDLYVRHGMVCGGRGRLTDEQEIQDAEEYHIGHNDSKID